MGLLLRGAWAPRYALSADVQQRADTCLPGKDIITNGQKVYQSLGKSSLFAHHDLCSQLGMRARGCCVYRR